MDTPPTRRARPSGRRSFSRNGVPSRPDPHAVREPDDSLVPDRSATVARRCEPRGSTVRLPRGVTLFDAASWNGIALDSTCGGHAPCKKCRLRVVDGAVPVSPLPGRAFGVSDLEDG